MKDTSKPYFVHQSSYIDENVEIGIIRFFSKSTSWEIKEQIAANEKTSKDILDALSEDPDEDIRVALLKNPNTSKEVVNKLSKDEHWKIREAIFIRSLPKSLRNLDNNELNLYIKENDKNE